MTSLIKADNIAKADGTSEVATEYVTQGSAKAWVNLNGTGTISARDSLNASSFTDLGSGTYRQNFSSAMSNANYSVNVCGDSGASGIPTHSLYAAQITASYNSFAYTNGTTYTDDDYVFQQVFGDLA